MSLNINSLDIKNFREKFKLSQSEFAELIGSSLRTVQNYEANGKIPASKNAIMRKIFEDYEDKINKTLTPVSNAIISSDVDIDTFYNSNGNKYTIRDDGSIHIEVVCVPFPAYASYLEVYMDEQQVLENFSKTTFRVDKVGKGYYIAFIVKGDSMNGGGINDTPDGAEILAREIKRDLWCGNFRKEKYGYVLLTKSNIFIKDIEGYNSETGKLTLSSRNPECENFEIDINDVNRIFNVIKRNF